MKRRDYHSEDASGVARMVEEAEDGLLRLIIEREFHELQSICPPTVDRKYDLRPRPHAFLLPSRDYNTGLQQIWCLGFLS